MANAHLSFVEKYQKDIMAFMGDSKLIEHEPVLGNAAKLRYVTAYNAHKTLRNRKGGYYSGWLGEGWPQPIVTIESVLDSDNDSSDKNYPSDGKDDEIQVFIPFKNSQCGYLCLSKKWTRRRTSLKLKSARIDVTEFPKIAHFILL